MSTPGRTMRAMTDRHAYTYIAVFSAALYTVLLIAPVVAGKLAQQFQLTAAGRARLGHSYDDLAGAAMRPSPRAPSSRCRQRI